MKLHQYTVWITEEFREGFTDFLMAKWPDDGITDYDYEDSIEE